MMDLPAYERDPYLQQLSAEVIATGELDGRGYALLSASIFYPEGGGQPADHGWIGDSEVVDVQKHEGEIRHFLSETVEPGPVQLRLDWRRRYDHMQQHSAQHLISALAADRFGWKTTSFHLSEGLCDIELDVASLEPRQIGELEEAIAVEVRAARPITARRVAPEALKTLSVRTRGLPAGHSGTVRLVEIEGLDLNTCAGTHVASTAELESVKLLHSESMRGGTRLYWLAGNRVRQRLGQREGLIETLRHLVGAADADLPEVIAGKLAQLKEEGRRARYLEGQLAERLGQALATEAGEGVASRHFPAARPSLLQQVGRAFAAQARDGAALLTADTEGGAFFLLALGAECPLDLKAAGSHVAQLLAGRGGGSGSIFQGKAGSLERREEAAAWLQRAVSEPPR